MESKAALEESLVNQSELWTPRRSTLPLDGINISSGVRSRGQAFFMEYKAGFVAICKACFATPQG
jgi:hypothetical protein